jgi:2-keto-4-pentenoate hydratase/2-oxohepta-3-ene-1,7-dioic acid hydratase in catechol pathway
MRLVTYDRGGQRRLGAILEGEVVDLPDVVGHPAFPTTLEGLVSSSRGTVLDAARAALEQDDALDHRVKRPRVLTPLFPTSLLTPDTSEIERRLVGPEQEVPWPEGTAWLAYEPKIAAILGLEAARVFPEDIGRYVFGYTLVNDWRARDASGSPVEHEEALPIAIGPVVVTTEDLDPQTIYVQVKVDDREVDKGNLNGAAASLLGLLSDVSQERPLGRGDALALAPFPGREHELWPGARVELAAEGIGTLRNVVAAGAGPPR